MTVTCYKSRNRVYQRVGEVAQYIREAYEVDGLPRDSSLSDPEIYGLALEVEGSPLPQENTFKDGLPMTAVVIERKLRSGSQARITITWGRRRNGSIVTTRTKAQALDTQVLIQPYLVVTPTPSGDIWARKERKVFRGAYRIFEGQYVTAGFNEGVIHQQAASLVNRLYIINNQPALFRGVDTIRQQSGELWVWSIFDSTGFVKAVEENELEPGQKPILELPPLFEYGQVNELGTPTRSPAENYEEGIPLPWRLPFVVPP